MTEKPIRTTITCGDICWLSSCIYIDERCGFYRVLRVWILQGAELEPMGSSYKEGRSQFSKNNF